MRSKKQSLHPSKGFLRQSLLLAMATVLTLTLVACGPSGSSDDDTSPSEPAQLATEVIVPGVYTQMVYNYDMLGDITTLEMGYGTEQTLFERNTLILTDNPDSNRDLVSGGQPYMEEGNTQRYELTKEFFVGSRGIHRIASFYGTYTVDGLNVTLNTPEYWSYLGYEGDGYASFNKPECAEFMIPTGETAANGTDYSLKFSGAIMPRHNGTNDPQTIVIDPNNFTFEYPVGNPEDDE